MAARDKDRMLSRAAFPLKDDVLGRSEARAQAQNDKKGRRSDKAGAVY
jgi:hypothetical protein